MECVSHGRHGVFCTAPHLILLVLLAAQILTRHHVALLLQLNLLLHNLDLLIYVLLVLLQLWAFDQAADDYVWSHS